MLLHPGHLGPLRRRGPRGHHLRRLDADLHAHPLDPGPQPRRALPLELVVRKQTQDTARLYGLGDRGRIEPGMLADLNVIDYEHLALGNPRVSADLPAGGRRLLQEATGYVATIKGGVATFEGGWDTGARPGRLVRGAR